MLPCSISEDWLEIAWKKKTRKKLHIHINVNKRYLHSALTQDLQEECNTK